MRYAQSAKRGQFRELAALHSRAAPGLKIRPLSPTAGSLGLFGHRKLNQCVQRAPS